jgi:DNA-binding Lrp family transcriptional regulator
MAADTDQIDQLDCQLIAALRDQPHVGLLEISRQTGVARGTVQARISKLEKRGIITGYGPEIEPAKMGYPIAAFAFIQLSQGRLDEAVQAARAVPEVLEVDAVSGVEDLICRVVARDTEHLQEIVNGLVASEAIQRCTTHIVLSRQVAPRSAPLLQSAARPFKRSRAAEG